MLGRMVARSAHDAAAVPAGEAAGRVDDLRGKHCLVVSYRRDGTPIPTPVWFGLDEGRVYFRAEGDSGKVKRIRANPTVRLAPCDSRGRPTGPLLEATARVLAPGEEHTAERAIGTRYGPGRRLYERWFTLPGGVYVECTPA